MKIKSITINNYKSIKTPQSINIDNNLITLLGKNCCGKTNVLQAVFSFFKRFDYRNEYRGAYSATFELNADEMQEFEAAGGITDQSILVEYNGNAPDVSIIKSEFLTSNISQYKKELKRINDEFNTIADKYIKELNKLESNTSSYSDLHISGYSKIGNGINNINHDYIQRVQERIKETYNAFAKYIEDVFQDNHIIVDDNNRLDYNLHLYSNIEVTQLQYEQIILSPALMERFNLDDNGLEEINKKLIKKVNAANEKLKCSVDKLNAKSKEFKRITDKIRKIFLDNGKKFYDIQEKNEEVKSSLISRIKKEKERQCYFLDNENSLLLSNSAHQDYSKINEDYNNMNPIMQAVHEFLNKKKLYNEDESIFKISDMNQERVKQIVEIINEKFLSKLRPNFENNTYKRIFFDLNNQGNLVLKIEEQSGDIIFLNETSLGRRWFFTYCFIKELLKAGDIFFIDEPAAFLHPSAQADVLKSLIDLSQKGITIIFSTHSPYMISNIDSKLINIEMINGETTIKPINQENFKLIANNIGLININDLLLGLNKTQILVEGYRDVVCLTTIMRELKININDYAINYIDGAFNIDKLIEFFDNNKINYKILLDADTKNWQDAKNENKLRIANFLKNYKKDKLYFAGENCERKEIEGLFSENDALHHFEKNSDKMKVKIQLIESIKEHNLEKETLDNFKKLFIKMGILDDKH